VIFFSNKAFFHYEIRRKLVEQWNMYLYVKWDCVQKHFKLHNLKLGPSAVVSWLICWSAADFLLLLHTTTIWTLTEVVKIICISWIEWHSCWRRESAGMWNCVIGWVFPSVLKGHVTKSHSITSVKTWIWIFNSDKSQILYSSSRDFICLPVFPYLAVGHLFLRIMVCSEVIHCITVWILIAHSNRIIY
jgi:hypothetical protein